MTIDTLRRLALFVLLCLAQALVFNRIQLFGCATPLLYVYFILSLPWDYPRWGILLWSFAMGVSVDMFANTPGVASTALTLLGAVHPFLTTLFLPRDAEPRMTTSAKKLGWGKFLTLAVIFVMLYCLVFFALESFSLHNLLHTMKCWIGSTLLTLLLIMPFEAIRK